MCFSVRAALALASLAVFLLPAAARANTITVTVLVGPDPTDAQCTLVEAIERATGTAMHAECAPTGPAGPLVVALPAGTGTFTPPSSSGAALPVLSGTFTIRGAGAAMTILESASPSPMRFAI